jgi:hypothetical protein
MCGLLPARRSIRRPTQTTMRAFAITEISQSGLLIWDEGGLSGCIFRHPVQPPQSGPNTQRPSKLYGRPVPDRESEKWFSPLIVLPKQAECHTRRVSLWISDWDNTHLTAEKRIANPDRWRPGGRICRISDADDRDLPNRAVLFPMTTHHAPMLVYSSASDKYIQTITIPTKPPQTNRQTRG